jgi:hypothetical protein
VWSGGRYGENCKELGDGNVLHDDDVCWFCFAEVSNMKKD